MREHDNIHASADPRGYIDAHVHVWTDDLDRYPLAAGFTTARMSPPRFTPDDLISLARPVNVNRIVLIQMYFYEFDNSYMLDAIQRYPGVFSGVALVDQCGPAPAAAMRELRRQGVRGVRICPPCRGATDWLDGAGMRSMWSAAADEYMPMCLLIDPEDLPAADRMCQQFPATPVVIDHFARIGVEGTFPVSDVRMLCQLAKYREVYVKLSAFYALGSKRPPYVDVIPMIRRIRDVFPPNRLMWATDSPFQAKPPHSYRASLELIRDHLEFASAHDRDWILRRTAENLFFS